MMHRGVERDDGVALLVTGAFLDGVALLLSSLFIFLFSMAEIRCFSSLWYVVFLYEVLSSHWRI
jgi:hypothetical protein